MRLQKQVRFGLVMATVASICAGLGAAAGIQKLSPADAAARMSGTWVLNRELTSGFKAPGQRGGGRGGSPRFSMGPSYGQRGGAGPSTASDATDMTAADRADMMAMRELQQLPDTITIKASADQVIFEDVRGQRTYTLDGKTLKVTVADTQVGTKSRWDKTVLKQEFSTTSSKLTQTWDVDENGRLVLTAKVESLKLRTPDQKAVFDKKP